MRYALLFMLVPFLAACGSDSPMGPELTSGHDVVTAMHDRYDGKWYETMTFIQQTIQYQPDGSVDTTAWYEAMDLPGKLRIDIGAPDSGDSWIFRSDSIYVFAAGEQVNAGPTMHPLLLLGFDIYHADPAATAAKLDSLGFDLNSVYASTWQDRPVIVVGANGPDEATNQFWIDTERLVFVRLLQRQGAVTQDIRFDEYEPLGNGWVAPEVLFYVDSTLTLRESYSRIQHDVTLPDGFFDPATAIEASHWYVP